MDDSEREKVGKLVNASTRLVAQHLELQRVLGMALEALPDRVDSDPCWGWAWNELNDDAQSYVKKVRAEILHALARLEAP